MWDEINRKEKMSRFFPEWLENWSGHSSKAMGGAGSQGKTGPFKFQMFIRCPCRCNQISSCCPAAWSCVSQEFKPLWTGGTSEDSALQDNQRGRQRPSSVPGVPSVLRLLPDAAVLCISVRKLFSHPLFFKLWKAALWKMHMESQYLNRPWNSRQLVILESWYINTLALWLLGWDNSEVHALPNFPLSLWD